MRRVEKTGFDNLVKMRGLLVKPMGRTQNWNRRSLYAKFRYFLKLGDIGME